MLHQIAAHQLGISSVVLHGTVLCSTSNDDTAALWDLRSFDRIASLTAHKDCVNNSLFTKDGLGLLTCSDDRTVLCWDARQLAAPCQTLRGFKDGVNKMIFSPDGSKVISACDDGLVYVHDTQSTELIDEFWVATNTVNDIVLANDGHVLITCSEDCAIRTWKMLYAKEATSEDRLIASFDEFENPVNHTELHDGWLYAACSECIFAVDFAAGAGGLFGEESRVFSCHTDYVRGMTFSPSSGGGNMLSCSDDGTIVEWDVATSQPVRQVKLHDSQIMAMTRRGPEEEGACTEGELLVTGCEEGLIRFWALPFTTEKI